MTNVWDVLMLDGEWGVECNKLGGDVACGNTINYFCFRHPGRV